ncbi:MAG: leucyl aminopeptidase [Dehalococcoidia bacterium]|jgi:leucyl aminopeptidase
MQISTQSGHLPESSAGALVVALFEDSGALEGVAADVDAALGGMISQLVREGEVKGKRNETTLIHTLGRLPSPRVLIVGLAKRDAFDGRILRNAFAVAARQVRRAGAESAAVAVEPLLGAGRTAQAIVEGMTLGLYTFTRHKKPPEEERDLHELILLAPDGSQEAVEDGVERGRIGAEATNWVRDLSNEPANFMTPSDLAERAQQVAEELGLECEVFERPEIEEMGMGAFLGVAQGSRQPPKLIVLHYRGGAPDGPTLGLVGKGITFDSGGISIKPSQGMQEMKSDMTGGAEAIATVRALAQLKAKLNVTAVVPATENMPGGSAQRPGDVVQAMNGTTIEVLNTDAEGRLILADALCYATRLGLSPIVDVATLTGAMTVTLGNVAFGAMTNSEGLYRRINEAAEAAGERVWELPLFEEYREKLDSDVADIKNISGGGASTIIGGFFLKEFVGDVPWAHLDIASVDHSDEVKGIFVKGASGTGVRTLIALGLSLAERPLSD